MKQKINKLSMSHLCKIQFYLYFASMKFYHYCTLTKRHNTETR